MLNDFDDQERNVAFVKTDFQVLKFKFHACNFKQAFYPLYKLYTTWPWQHENTSFSFGIWLSNLHV